MAETPNIPKEIQDLLKILNALGPDLQIPYRKGKTQRFITGDELVPIYTPRKDDPNKGVFDIGFKVTSGKRVEYQRIPGASLPFGSYGTMVGQPAVLNVKGTDKKTLGGASIIDRAVAALEKPEVFKRVQTLTGYSASELNTEKNKLRQDLSAPTRASSKLTEIIYPSGRNPDARETRILEVLKLAGLVEKTEDGRFFNRSRALDKDETARATRIIKYPIALRDKLRALRAEYDRVAGLFGPGKGKAGGTREVAPHEVKRFAELQREIVKLQEQLDERLKPRQGKSTPALKAVEPNELRRLAKALASADLPEPPTAIDTRDTRQAKAEAKKYQAQRNAEMGTDSDQIRGSQSASPAQKELILKLAEDLKEKDPKAYLKFLEKNPEFRNYIISKSGSPPVGPQTAEEAAKIAAPPMRALLGTSGGTVLVDQSSREAGIRAVPNRPAGVGPLDGPRQYASSNTTGEPIYGPGTYVTKKKAGALLNLLFSLGQRIPKNPQLATGEEALASLPRLPTRGVGGSDVLAAEGAARFAGAQPLVMTPEQAAMPIEAKAAARDIVDVSRKIQQGFTRDQETKLIGEIDKAIRALGEASPSNALDKAKLAIRLAKKQVAFGNTADLSAAQKEFVDMTIAQVNQIKSDLGSPWKKIVKRAEGQIRMLEAAGFSELDPKSVAEQAKFIWTLNTAGAAVRALDLKGRELKPQEQDITSKRIEPFMKDTGEVGSKIGTPPTLISPMQLSDYASNLQRAGTSRQVQESNRRAARGEPRSIPTGGLAPTEAENFKPGLRNPGDIQGYRLQQNAGFNMRYEELVRLAQQRRVANMPEPPPDPAVVARGRVAGRPRRVAESLLVRMMGR